MTDMTTDFALRHPPLMFSCIASLPRWGRYQTARFAFLLRQAPGAGPKPALHPSFLTSVIGAVSVFFDCVPFRIPEHANRSGKSTQDTRNNAVH